MAEEITYTQEQLNEALETAKNDWKEQELNPIVAERDDLLQYKPKEVSEAEKAMVAKQEELWNKEVSLSLKEHGLESFASIVKVSNEEELKGVIETLNTFVNELKVSMGYVPSEHNKQSEYSAAESKKDTKGMIASKFSKLFN
ncbi:hypothetical protein HLK66_04725 [Niallia circulans]|uniref:hypothetical protein n=1 Tax=Niallia circulans TaxID=1397 RepID=UPI00149064B4|nr:hypothetical protein [Niallia circulans]QJX61017.1 hypothetical protein HLK66_04725 [Niallia circulans]